MNRQHPDEILIVDDDANHLKTLKAIVGSWGFAVVDADDGKKAVECVKERPYDLILLDIRMAEMDGIAAMKQIKAYNPAIPILIMTAYSSVDTAVEALKFGAYDYLTKPLDFEELKLTMERALEHSRLKVENQHLKERLSADYELRNIIGRSEPMQALVDKLAMVAPSEATVLITGESGTGKELVAKSIHHNSPRKEKPLIIVNCAALAESLLESELFGHEKGAFTGAVKDQLGRFEMADNGSILLDEIGDISPGLQLKLLRIIQEKEFERVGGQRTLKVDVRIVAATNKNLELAVEEGTFRGDLYYRLNVFPIYMPPLRERKTDILLLADYFLEKYAKENGKEIKRFSTPAIDMLMAYHWPGNVRELENCIERSVLLCDGGVVHSYHLPPTLQTGTESDTLPELSMEDAVASLEREMIVDALKNTRGNITTAAQILKTTVRKFSYKAKRYGIHYSHYR